MRLGIATRSSMACRVCALTTRRGPGHAPFRRRISDARLLALGQAAPLVPGARDRNPPCAPCRKAAWSRSPRNPGNRDTRRRRLQADRRRLRIRPEPLRPAHARALGSAIEDGHYPEISACGRAAGPDGCGQPVAVTVRAGDEEKPDQRLPETPRPGHKAFRRCIPAPSPVLAGIGDGAPIPEARHKVCASESRQTSLARPCRYRPTSCQHSDAHRQTSASPPCQSPAPAPAAALSATRDAPPHPRPRRQARRRRPVVADRRGEGRKGGGKSDHRPGAVICQRNVVPPKPGYASRPVFRTWGNRHWSGDRNQQGRRFLAMVGQVFHPVKRMIPQMIMILDTQSWRPCCAGGSTFGG